MITFGQLPLELLLHIFGSLHPLEVVRTVRKVCRTFHAASHIRSLWRDLLLQVCIENSISPHTYNLENMSPGDFEHATTTPRRFMETYLRKPSPDNSQTITPSSRRYLDFQNEELYQGRGFEDNIIRLYLVPGGRFLLTHHSHAIYMWDLGVPGSPQGPPKLPIGAIDLHQQGFNGPPAIAPHPTRDGKGILVSTCLDDTSETNICLRDMRVYSIEPTLSEPSFKLLRNHPLLLSGDSYGLLRLGYEKMVMLFENQMRVWDFVADESAVWKVDVVGQYESIFLKDEFVILCDARGLTIWNIPELHPCNSARASDLQDYAPIASLQLQDEVLPEVNFNYEGLADWYYSTGQPFYFDFVICPVRTVHLTRYRLDFVLSEKDSPCMRGMAPGKLKKLMSFTVPEDEGVLEEFRVADDNIVMYWSAPNGLNIQSIPMDMESRGASEPIVVVYQMPMVDRYLSTLCSSSGRVCHLMASHVIEIADFVPRPGVTE